MHKKIINKHDLMDPKKQGMDKIADIVKSTLGPGGLVVMIQRHGQALDGLPLGPKLTKDGVSVAMECADESEEIDVVIQAVKNICKKTNSDAGDGTTTAIVLGQAILNETEFYLGKNPKLNPQIVKESVERTSKEVIECLKDIAEPVETIERIKQVATISANGEEEIGEILGQAFDRVGAEGVVTVDEGPGLGVTLDVVEGYQFNRGAVSRDRFFNNSTKTSFEAEDVAVILFDGKINSHADVIPIFEKLAGVDPNIPIEHQQLKKLPPILFIANDFSQEVVTFFDIQKQRMGTSICAVIGPHMTNVRSAYYKDLAAYTGGEVLGNGAKSLINIDGDDIGLVSRVVIDKYKTTLYEGQGLEEDIIARVDQLKAAKDLAESPYDAQIINDRIAALTGGIAKIGVGGATELEIKEKYDRIEDALNAARAAIQEGVVPGGGTTLLRIAKLLSDKKDKTPGDAILSKALQAPFYQILENIGRTLSKEDVEKITVIKNSETNATVYDARNNKIVNAMEEGIIDPVKVTRSALANAISISGLLSTTGGAIIYKK